ncbi:hypothetical protein L1987_06964 [Smallanthus sonchifolius]|uniref:Uncharacterized protein n=1 Tax=Smallanthus sonchifolius TaxID=185202 RepID=A0ACB9JZN5_9ASTR|nr:hypothetical protein L1987_06964 [Smallanthus sonchifolius]
MRREGGGGGGERWTEEFVLKEELWKECLLSAVVWEGQKIPFERVVKIRIEGLSIVLRYENSYRDIAGLYGRVIEPVEFSWDRLDVSSNSCLVLHNFGKKIDEEITVTWNNQSYPVWVKEIEHSWPPEMKETLDSDREGISDGDGTGLMDLEEGEIRPMGVPELRKMGFPINGNPETQGGGETPDHAGETEGRQTMHGKKNTAHVGGNFLGSPRTPRNKNIGSVVEMHQGGLSIKMSHEYGASSRKRPRCHRSPTHIDPSNNNSMGGDGDIRIVIPPFPCLNNPTNFYSGASDVLLSAETSQPNGIFGTDFGSVVPESQSAGNLGDADKEVAATIEVGNCVAIQVGDFANQWSDIAKLERYVATG